MTHSKKITVAIVFGGASAEHDVSVQSARSIVAALDTHLFNPILIWIDRQGTWYQQSPQSLMDEHPRFTTAGGELCLALGGSRALINRQSHATVATLDALFPVLHGTRGEDGAIQGLCQMADVPCVGTGLLGSAICMDKDVAKRLLRQAGIAVAESVTLYRSERPTLDVDAIVQRLGLPLFVKPANSGSSVGVTRVAAADQLAPAVDQAFTHDRKILIEVAIDGDEVECAVLGSDVPRVSEPGRIAYRADFYDYNAKYHDASGTMLQIPAALSSAMRQKVQAIALSTYRTLECTGMARVDLFVTADDQVLVNEVNTIPGFTQFSMYPKLWEASGVPYQELVTKLIQAVL